jgi:phosphatidylethanolamine-binding protein (PEBP) family uncharacterized protein
VRDKEVFTMRHKTFLMLFVLFFMALSGSIETFHAAESMVIKSPAFLQGAMIPARYTCDGVNVSPPLERTHPCRKPVDGEIQKEITLKHKW